MLEEPVRDLFEDAQVIHRLPTRLVPPHQSFLNIDQIDATFDSRVSDQTPMPIDYITASIYRLSQVVNFSECNGKRVDEGIRYRHLYEEHMHAFFDAKECNEEKQGRLVQVLTKRNNALLNDRLEQLEMLNKPLINRKSLESDQRQHKAHTALQIEFAYMHQIKETLDQVSLMTKLSTLRS